MIEDTLLLPSIAIYPRVLIIDSDPAASRILEEGVEPVGYTSTSVSSAEAALQLLAVNFMPLVILNSSLPGLDGLEFCRHVRARTWPSYVYLVVRTSDDGETDVINALDAGADECLSKTSSFALLIARLKTARRILSQEQALKCMLAKRRQMSLTDALTGAYNRRYLMKYGERAVSSAQLRSEPLCLLAVDIDHFKVINDTFGHAAGDFVLVEFVRRLARLLRKHEWCARMGGEEFAIFLPRSDLDRARRVAERVRRTSSEEPFRTAGKEIWLTASIGVAVLGVVDCGSNTDLSKLLREADAGLYRSKRTGRNKVSVALAP